MTTLSERVRELFVATPSVTRNYYALTLLLDENSQLEFSCQTRWAGFTDGSPRREIRTASLDGVTRQ